MWWTEASRLETDVVTGEPIPGEDHAGGYLFDTGEREEIRC